ncbi:tetratricopeptide repeat protein [Fodinibius sp. N2]|uniref:tetratricopeptide repeat protein n=1 Tax=Fodinibius alkaliphilus TaxID=3140241 RepID=UPI00315A18EF
MIESFNKKELEEKIDQYVNGQLSAQEVDELWAELIQDGYHLDYLKSVANLKAVVKQRREEQKRTSARKYWYYAAAAVIALLIGVLAFMNINNQQQSAIQPISSIELDYYRSGDGTITSQTSDKEVIQNAIRLANTGRDAEAISLLQNELNKATQPEWIAELSLNIGSLYYNQGAYNEAIAYYKQVIEHQENDQVDALMLEKAYWYIGNAHFHLDQLVDARANIEKAYELNGAYRRVAKSYLNALSD